MKHMRKIFALALALVMVLGLATTASATEVTDPMTPVNGPFTVTIKNATDHKYVIYQIFTGDLALNDANEEVLANVKYGTDYVPEGKAVGDEAEIPTDPTTIVPTGAGTAMTNNENGTATITVEKAGYYMIKDVTNPLPGQDTRSAVMFQVVGNTEITSKHTGTTIVKKTQDINDSTGEYTTDTNGSTWIDSADYDIGDKVPFKSTANFEGMANYNTYKVIITDIMAEGLEYNKDMAITVNGQPCTSGYTIEVTENYASDDEYNGGTKIVVTFENIKGVNGTVNDAEVVLNYSATLDTDANVGIDGNPNKIKATTKPNGEGENDTPWDVNIIFTFKTDVNKVDPELKPLTGAEFTLEKFVASAEGTETFKGEQGNWVVKTLVKNDAGTVFSFKGLDDGEYRITETQAPTGYNKIDPIYFTVNADHTVVADLPALETLEATATKPDGSSYTEEEIKSGEVATFKITKADGLVETDIVNNAGVELPETGGMGTTIFYAIGGLLVAAAVILLVTKKRMASAE